MVLGIETCLHLKLETASQARVAKGTSIKLPKRSMPYTCRSSTGRKNACSGGKSYEAASMLENDV